MNRRNFLRLTGELLAGLSVLPKASKSEELCYKKINRIGDLRAKGMCMKELAKLDPYIKDKIFMEAVTENLVRNLMLERRIVVI